MLYKSFDNFFSSFSEVVKSEENNSSQAFTEVFNKVQFLQIKHWAMKVDL